jgi:hypothetical protein
MIETMGDVLSEELSFESPGIGLTELKSYIFGMLNELARLAHDAQDDALADRLRAIALDEKDFQSQS